MNLRPSLLNRCVRACAAAFACATAAAFAQAPWQPQPLKIIVPFAPGGSSDFIARLITKPLSDGLKVPAIVENRAGNAGNVDAAYVAMASGQHTILLSDLGSLAISAIFDQSSCV
jgi:tripartite-type tricarboxylate transporter receptor subunit TctC